MCKRQFWWWTFFLIAPISVVCDIKSDMLNKRITLKRNSLHVIKRAHCAHILRKTKSQKDKIYNFIETSTNLYNLHQLWS